MKREMMERNGRMRARGRIREKVEGIKRGVLSYITTSSFPPPTIMIIVATPLWPSVGVKPNTLKSWRFGVATPLWPSVGVKPNTLKS